MTDCNQILPSLTILGIGLAFGYMIGMLWYYPIIVSLRNKVKKFMFNK